jgi:hypothetical protein
MTWQRSALTIPPTDAHEPSERFAVLPALPAGAAAACQAAALAAMTAAPLP